MTIGENVVVGLRLNRIRNQNFSMNGSKIRCAWLLFGTKLRMICTSQAPVFRVAAAEALHRARARRGAGSDLDG